MSRKIVEIYRIWGSSVWLLDSRWIGKTHLCVCVYTHMYVNCHPRSYPWGVCSKTLSECLKPWIVPNSMYTMFFPIHTHLWQSLLLKWGSVREYLYCPYHYSCDLGPLLSKISVTQTQVLWNCGSWSDNKEGY